jgi:hypothetical protein
MDTAECRISPYWISVKFLTGFCSRSPHFTQCYALRSHTSCFMMSTVYSVVMLITHAAGCKFLANDTCGTSCPYFERKMTKNAIQMVFIGALLILSFCSAKVAPTSHDMRMEDFEIYRKEWNKRSTKFPLKFSPDGEVLKLSGISEQSQKRYF